MTSKRSVVSNTDFVYVVDCRAEYCNPMLNGKSIF